MAQTPERDEKTKVKTGIRIVETRVKNEKTKEGLLVFQVINRGGDVKGQKTEQEELLGADGGIRRKLFVLPMEIRVANENVEQRCSENDRASEAAELKASQELDRDKEHQFTSEAVIAGKMLNSAIRQSAESMSM
ncbi:hypothetical protein NDU88_001983 [Pleurodeles waltl]|uniref:Uncharacterized protein n=1 Tax=Pleurodeles waltl TaxID=8319 RepID=A0AAV7TKH0_PLEWA|nr:hypothetical protein NDU88_001983 [Pleurodeles waltl]